MKARAKLLSEVWDFEKTKYSAGLKTSCLHSKERPRPVIEVKALLLGVTIWSCWFGDAVLDKVVLKDTVPKRLLE